MFKSIISSMMDKTCVKQRLGFKWFVGKSLVWEEKIVGAATIVADSRV